MGQKCFLQVFLAEKKFTWRFLLLEFGHAQYSLMTERVSKGNELGSTQSIAAFEHGWADSSKLAQVLFTLQCWSATFWNWIGKLKPFQPWTGTDTPWSGKWQSLTHQHERGWYEANEMGLFREFGITWLPRSSKLYSHKFPANWTESKPISHSLST